MLKNLKTKRLRLDLSSASMLLLMLLVVTFVMFLGQTLFNTKGEPREAIVALSMLQQDNWILPVSCGGDIPYKPPFMAWCIAVLAWLNGGVVNEFVSRLPSALAMIAMTMMVMRFYARRTDVWTAMATSLVLMTAFEVHRAATNCRVDMLLTFFIVSALLQLLVYRQRGRRGVSLLAVLLMSGGVLTKGPVGVILPCMVIFVYRLIRGDRFWGVFFTTAISAILACVIPALWYVAAYHQGGDHFLSLVMEENFGRFTGTMTYESHVNPPSYNLISLLAGFLPYTLLMLFALFAIRPRRGAWAAPTQWPRRFWHWLRGLDDVKLYSLLSAVLIFVFYCIPKSKRSVYLLPVYPFLAYFIVLAVKWMTSQHHILPIRVYAWTLAVMAALVPPLYAAIRMGVFTLPGRTGQMLVDVAQLHIPLVSLCVLALLLPAALWAMWEFTRSDARRIFSTTLLLTLGIYWAFSAVLQPSFLNIKSDYPVACRIDSIVPEGPVYSFVDDPYLRFYTINFYLDDRVKLVDKDLPADGYMIVGERDLDAFCSRLGSHYALIPVFATSKKGCDVKQPLLFFHIHALDAP